jgi:adenosine 3'-phospho 5'-phosphosulfate transporter B3
MGLFDGFNKKQQQQQQQQQQQRSSSELPDVEKVSSLTVAKRSASSGSGNFESSDDGALVGDDAYSRVPLSPQPPKEKDPIKLWGVKLLFSEKAIFWLLAMGALFAYLGFTTVQEYVFRNHAKEAVGFRFGGVVTLTTSFTYALLGFLERLANDEFRDSSSGGSGSHSRGFNALMDEQHKNNASGSSFNIFRRRAKLKDYVILATMTSGGMYLTNFSLSYINYTTRIVAKCSKVIPTMVMGALMQGRRYEKKDYFAALTLVCGVCLFALGDKASLPQFQPKGVVMIVFALFIEAAAGNFEEKRLFNVSLPASHAEVVMHANIIGLFMTMFGMTLNGEIWLIISYMNSHPECVLRAMTAAAFGYMSVSFILLSIRQYGATNTEIIKALRKMLSIGLSLILYPKPMGWRYVTGTCVTAFGIMTLYAIKKRRYVKAAGNVEAFK